MSIDHAWICKHFGIKSDCFCHFNKESSKILQEPEFNLALKNWSSSFPSQQYLQLENILAKDVGEPVDDNIIQFFLRYTYLAWILHKYVNRLLPGYKFPEKIWTFFAWISEFQTILFPSSMNFAVIDSKRKDNSYKGDLFGDLLNEILMLNIREEKGMFYTPAILSDFITGLLSNNHILQNSKNILDPTCGSGSILLPLVHGIMSSDLSLEKKRNSLLAIHGNDENPVAVLATIVNILSVLSTHDLPMIFFNEFSTNFSCNNVFDFHTLDSNHEFSQKFDLILGNLPWNVINNIQDPNVKDQIISIGKTFDIIMTWKNRSNLEIATVLFKILQTHILKEGGYIAFLLPASLLTATQHSKFRRFEGLSNIQSYHISPDFFPIHAMFLVGQKTDIRSRDGHFLNILAHYYRFQETSGVWTLRQTEILEPSHISYHRDKPLVGKYCQQQDKMSQLPIKKGFYHPKVKRGVDITPRRLLFLKSTEIVHGAYNRTHKEGIKIFPDLSQGTSTQSSTWNIVPYQSSTVDANDIKKILKSTDLIPFIFTNFHFAFLPVRVVDNHYFIQKIDKLSQNSKKHLKKLEEVYETHRISTSKNRTLVESINYGQKINDPDMRSPLKIVYPVGGSYCKAAILRDPEIILDVTFYYLPCQDENEAYYLLAWLNSSILQKNLHRVCTIGANGSIRVIHMAPWMFPFPKFEGTKIQLQLAHLGKEFESIVYKLYKNENIPNITAINNTNKGKVSLTKIYKLLRNNEEFQNKSLQINKILMGIMQAKVQ